LGRRRRWAAGWPGWWPATAAPWPCSGGRTCRRNEPKKEAAGSRRPPPAQPGPRERRLFLVREDRFLDRTGALALGGDVAVDEFDDRHRRVVAVAEAGLQHADVAAVPVGVARAEDREQLADHLDVAQAADGDAAAVQVAALGQGDQLL